MAGSGRLSDRGASSYSWRGVVRLPSREEGLVGRAEGEPYRTRAIDARAVVVGCRRDDRLTARPQGAAGQGSARPMISPRAGCGSQSRRLSAAPLPSPAAAAGSPTTTIPAPNPTAFQRLQTAGQRLLVSEFGTTADTIVALDPADVAGSREVIATIDHAPEYGDPRDAFASRRSDRLHGACPSDTERASPASPATAGHRVRRRHNGRPRE